MIASSVNKLDA